MYSSNFPPRVRGFGLGFNIRLGEFVPGIVIGSSSKVHDSENLSGHMFISPNRDI